MIYEIYNVERDYINSLIVAEANITKPLYPIVNDIRATLRSKFDAERILYILNYSQANKESVSGKPILECKGFDCIVVGFLTEPLNQHMQNKATVDEYKQLLANNPNATLIILTTELPTKLTSYVLNQLSPTHHLIHKQEWTYFYGVFGYLTDDETKNSLPIIQKLQNPNFKRFLCLNGRATPSRTIIASYILQSAKQNTYLSYQQTHGHESKKVFKDNVQFQHLISGYEQLLASVPITLDIEIDYEHNNHRPSIMTYNGDMKHKVGSNPNLDFYNCTAINIVTETTCRSNKETWLSEKIMRPIGMNQAFIAVGDMHILKYLKELGFKTFHPYIDESYDNESKPSTRLLMIMKEIERLNNLPEQEFIELASQLSAIASYNKQYILGEEVSSRLLSAQKEVNEHLKEIDPQTSKPV